METVDVNKLFEELGALPQVEAIALGGSRATGRHDEKSDYDVYIYLTEAVDTETRRSVLEKYCRYMEIGNAFWELEDDVTLNDGIDMDIIYRDMENEEETRLLKAAVEKLNPREKQIICLRYGIGQKDGQEMTQKEVADLLGISQSHISRLEKKIILRLGKEIRKN